MESVAPVNLTVLPPGAAWCRLRDCPFRGPVGNVVFVSTPSPLWDQRYAEDGFAYGTEPNDFLREHAGLLSGPVLSLAEGQGRNAVFLAGLGLPVVGVDSSSVGLLKAQELARSKGVQIEAVVADLATFDPGVDRYGSVIAIFAHLPGELQRRVNRRVWQSLRVGGVFLLEAYTPAQVLRNTGGPRDPNLCVTLAALQSDFAEGEHVVARECVRPVVEGRFHTGLAEVVQFIARKRG